MRDGECTIFWVLALAGCLFAGGCGTLDSSKALNHQNAGAGRFIAANSTQPEIAAAGQDVADNADAIAKDIGEPDAPTAYSRQESATLRNRQAAEIAARDARNALIDQALAAGSAFLGLSTVYAWFKRAKDSKILKTVVKGIEDLPQETFDQVKAALIPASLKAGVADPLHAIVKANTPN